MNKLTQTKCIDSPLGKITLKSLNNKLVSLQFLESENSYSDDILDKATSQLAQYFAGNRKNFDLTIDVIGTHFQRAAWSILQQIPYGSAWSYQRQAMLLGDVKKCRAVGRANSANPLPVIIPCHRVIAKNGGLQGYSGGLDIKKFLLTLEKAL